MATVTDQLAGQIPLITATGVTVKTMQAVFPSRRRPRRSSRRKSRGRKNGFGGVSPI